MQTLSQIVSLFFVLVLAACQQSQPSPEHVSFDAVTPPNIVIIVADDLGWGDIGANGSSLIKTPNIDRISAEGIRLTNFYAGSNVCTPSRAALMTGRYPIRSGMQHVITPRSQSGLPQSEVTIAELAQSAGYVTAMVGKWHLGHTDIHWPTAHGFEEFFGVPYSNDMQPFDLYHHKTIVESPAQQAALTERYANAASDFIRRNTDRPFFLYYAETFPHIPLHAPDHVTGRSDGGQYGDVVEHLDWGIGEILRALEDSGVEDNTLIIVTSDNGPWFEGDPGTFRNRKGGTHEGSYRVPFIARWPSTISAGEINDAMAMNIDLLPTAAKIMGADLPSDRIIDGENILPLLQGVPNSPHEVLFFFDGNDVVAARDERYRLVLNTYYRTYNVPFESYGAKLLFDLEADPQERYSYVREKQDIVEKLEHQVSRMREDVQHLITPAPNPFAPIDPEQPIGPQLHED